LATRFYIAPDPAFAELQTSLGERLARLGAGVHAAEFGALLDPLMRQTLQKGFDDAGAHEGTVWLLDESGENLEPAFNTGPDAEKFVGKFKQPLASGLICMVFATQQPFLENDVAVNQKQSKLLDASLRVETRSMIAVPFHFLRDCRGVISCVQLKRAGAADADAPGFTPASLAGVQCAASLLSRLLEFRLLAQVVGWNGE